MRKYLGLVVLALLAGAGGAALVNSFQSDQETKVIYQPSEVQLANYPSDIVEHPDFISASSEVTPAVVHIMVEGKTEIDEELMEPFRDFFGDRIPDLNRRSRGSGSGVIISSDGFVITNNHVVKGAENIEVVLNNRKSYAATVLGTDPSTDLALLRIDEENLPFLTFGNSDQVQVGEWVLAVGNPFNLTSTVTAGIVSAKARNINILGGGSNIESFIQTDAAVNPGNSGGALVNVRGELIGINTAIASRTGSYSGYSFAIPSQIAEKVIEDIKEFGMVQRGFLGVQIRDLDADMATELDLESTSGVYIPGFSPNSSAKEAGIEIGDVIVKVDDTEVNSSPELQEYVGTKRPGDKVRVHVIRNGKLKSYLVTLKNKAGNTEIMNNDELEFASAFGAEFKNLEKAELEKLDISSGVKINDLKSESPFRKAGIEEGFVITSIDKRKVTNVEQVLDLLSRVEDGVLVEGYTKSGKRAYVGVGLE